MTRRAWWSGAVCSGAVCAGAALLLALSAAHAEDRPLSPKRKALLAAVEEYHALERRCERAGYTDREYHDLHEQRKEAKHKVRDLKEAILKEERQKNDYYPNDPYAEHRRDPATGGAYHGKVWTFEDDEFDERPVAAPSPAPPPRK